MGRVVDITEKLTFDTKPAIRIKGVDIGINADAPSVLKIMALGTEESGGDAEDVLKALDILLDDEEREKLDEVKLSFADLVKFVEIAMNLATGNYMDEDGKEAGEDATP